MVEVTLPGGTEWSEVYCMMLRPRLKDKYRITLHSPFYSGSLCHSTVHLGMFTFVMLP